MYTAAITRSIRGFLKKTLPKYATISIYNYACFYAPTLQLVGIYCLCKSWQLLFETLLNVYKSIQNRKSYHR